uniref:Secreted protein n=1 Tax=Steinernema glaseri TaxID=37863 RepID=A0A1I8ADN3_9BILA
MTCPPAAAWLASKALALMTLGRAAVSAFASLLTKYSSCESQRIGASTAGGGLDELATRNKTFVKTTVTTTNNGNLSLQSVSDRHHAHHVCLVAYPGRVLSTVPAHAGDRLRTLRRQGAWQASYLAAVGAPVQAAASRKQVLQLH